MLALVQKDHLEKASQVTRDFVEFGWGEPDENGVRQVAKVETGESFYASIQPVMQQLEKDLNDKKVAPVAVYFSFLNKENRHKFGARFVYEDPVKEALYNLVQAWSDGRPIGTCHECGNLFSPAKGRTAKYCSANCRLKAHREGK